MIVAVSLLISLSSKSHLPSSHDDCCGILAHLVVVEVPLALFAVLAAVGQDESHAVVGRLALLEGRAPADVGAVGERERDADGVDLHDARERALRRRHVVAHVGGGLADLSADRCHHDSLLEVVLGHHQVGLRLQDGGFGLVSAGFRVIALLLSDAARVCLLHALPVALGATRLRLGGLEVGLALVRDGAVALVVQHVEDRSGLHDVAFLELDLLDVTINLRQEVHLLHRLGVRHEFLGEVVNALLDFLHGDRCDHLRHLRLLRLLFRPQVVSDPSAHRASRGQNQRSDNGANRAALAFIRFFVVVHCFVPLLKLDLTFDIRHPTTVAAKHWFAVILIDSQTAA